MKNKAIRCFAGSAQPHEPFWKIRNATDTSDAEIELYGYISEYSWYGDEITPKLFQTELDKLKGAPVTLRINSSGGDVIAASVIRSALTDYTGHVTARIDGICASAATMVALAADVVKLQDSAFFMIHDPSVSLMFADLDIETMQGLLDALKTVKGSLVGLYSGRTGISEARLAKMMSDETWLNASEAVKLGFADEIIQGGVASAVNQTTLQNFVNVPAALLMNAAPVLNIEQKMTPEERMLRDEIKMFVKKE